MCYKEERKFWDSAPDEHQGKISWQLYPNKVGLYPNSFSILNLTSNFEAQITKLPNASEMGMILLFSFHCFRLSTWFFFLRKASSVMHIYVEVIWTMSNSISSCDLCYLQTLIWDDWFSTRIRILWNSIMSLWGLYVDGDLGESAL